MQILAPTPTIIINELKERMSISQMSIKARKEQWRGKGIPGLLMGYNRDHERSCNRKQQHSFNRAVEVGSFMSWSGQAVHLDIYFCLHCFHYHLATGDPKGKELCVWCGSWIKRSKLESHERRCGTSSERLPVKNTLAATNQQSVVTPRALEPNLPHHH